METNLIEKEEIKCFKFNNCEVLSSNEKITQRFELLQQSAVLGNSYKHKLKIIFHSLEGKWMVYTTIWFASEAYIQLKGGIVIPVNVIETILINNY